MADRVPDDQTFHDVIEGYCGPSTHRPGDVVELRVSTHSRAFDVAVERWGASREPVWAAAGVPGTFHPPPADADAAGCGWPVAVSIPVDDTWRPGFHLVTLTASDGPGDRRVAHAGFVVGSTRADPDRPDILYVLATNTWHAYNTWGGRSLYTGGHRVSFERPYARGMLSRPEVDRDDRKARPTRFRESPDADGEIFQAYRTEHHYPSAIGSTGWFTHGRRFVEWAERRGHRFDYAVSSDLDADPAVLDGYSLVVLAGHDEYWSARQRDAVERFVAAGGNLASFSGNTMFWQVRIERDDRGQAMVCHKYRAHLDDPVVAAGRPESMSGMFADPLIGRPEWTLFGAASAFGLYHRFGQATPRGVGGFVVYRDDHWMLEGTGLRYGDVLGVDDGVVGYETVGCPIVYDRDQLPRAAPWVEPALPPGLELIAVTPSSNLGVGEYPTSIAALSDQGDLEFVAERLHGATDDETLARVRRGNAVIASCRPFGEGGGEVVTVGSTDWVFGLAHDAAVGQVTSNVIRRLASSVERRATGPAQ